MKKRGRHLKHLSYGFIRERNWKETLNITDLPSTLHSSPSSAWSLLSLSTVVAGVYLFVAEDNVSHKSIVLKQPQNFACPYLGSVRVKTRPFSFQKNKTQGRTGLHLGEKGPGRPQKTCVEKSDSTF